MVIILFGFSVKVLGNWLVNFVVSDLMWVFSGISYMCMRCFCFVVMMCWFLWCGVILVVDRYWKLGVVFGCWLLVVKFYGWWL